MIVSPPKAGKTTLLKQVAKSITTSNKSMHLIILLIDERPEEVTDIRESIQGDNVEVIYSTFDELPEHDQQTVLTARKLERFLTQPFYTTYQFTGMEGRSVDLEKTIEGCERILAGEFNYLSENDFFMVGDIDEVLAKTKDKKAAFEKAQSEEND